MPVIRIPDEVYRRLQKHAIPLEDTAADVIKRILDGYELQAEVHQPAAAIEPLSPSSGDFASFAEVWAAEVGEFNKLGPPVKATARGSAYFKPIWIGQKNVHYEWSARKRESRLDCCIHFEFADRAESLRRLADVAVHETAIRDGISLQFDAGPWGDKWAQLRFRVPYNGDFPDREAVIQAAKTMKTLMDRTFHLLGGRGVA